MRSLIAISFVVCTANLAAAIDLPFGADALPYLTRSADVIFKAGDATVAALPESQADSKITLSAYNVRAAQVMKGDIDAGAKITIVVPRSLDVDKAEQLDDDFIFVAGPLSETEKKVSGLGDGKFYMLLGGRNGAVDRKTDEREKAVKEFVAEKSGNKISDAAFTWAERYVRSVDPFLQRSAILEIAVQPKMDKAIQLLSDAVNADIVTPDNKRMAIKTLQASQSQKAIPALQEVAQTEKLPKGVRRAAVQAIGGIPGGVEELKKWSETKHEFLAPASQEVLRLWEGKTVKPR